MSAATQLLLVAGFAVALGVAIIILRRLVASRSHRDIQRIFGGFARRRSIKPQVVVVVGMLTILGGLFVCVIAIWTIIKG